MKPFLLGSLLLVLTASNLSVADNNRELRRAQKLAAAGDYTAAFSEYQRVAQEKDNHLAQFSIAMFYDYGWGRVQDPLKACQWYQKAAQADEIPLAADALGRCFTDGVYENIDYKQAAKWFQKAADLGHHYSLCHLGALYISGQGVEKDPAKGLALCQQSADQGSVPAMLKLASFYFSESDVREYKTALHWYSMAASYNSVEAEYQLGVMLRDGLGIQKNSLVALQWFEKSAGNGYLPAYYEVATLYFNAPMNPETGLWYENNLAKAYIWLSATLQRSKDDEQQRQAKQMLGKVLEVMPSTWNASLDAKVDAHMQKYADDALQGQSAL